MCSKDGIYCTNAPCIYQQVGPSLLQVERGRVVQVQDGHEHIVLLVPIRLIIIVDVYWAPGWHSAHHLLFHRWTDIFQLGKHVVNLIDAEAFDTFLLLVDTSVTLHEVNQLLLSCLDLVWLEVLLHVDCNIFGKLQQVHVSSILELLADGSGFADVILDIKELHNVEQYVLAKGLRAKGTSHLGGGTLR